jgi:hypothetical protein
LILAAVSLCQIQGVAERLQGNLGISTCLVREFENVAVEFTKNVVDLAPWESAQSGTHPS